MSSLAVMSTRKKMPSSPISGGAQEARALEARQPDSSTFVPDEPNDPIKE